MVMAVGVVLLASRAWRGRKKWRSPALVCGVVVAAACLSGVTGATEVRYLMPLHLSLAAVVFLGIRRDDLPTSWRARAGALAGVGLLVLALAVVSAQTMNHLVMPS
jgi:hypothetical protein